MSINFQNNYTTPEQSQRLIKLGIPTKSADCVYIVYNEGTDKEYYTLSVPMPHQSPVTEIVEKGNKDYTKGNVTFYYCWSVGRLIEIWLHCNKFSIDSTSEPITISLLDISESFIDDFIHLLKKAVGSKHIDFSKLED